MFVTMLKKLLSSVLAIILTTAITTNTYAADIILNSISAGAAKKASVSSDTGVRTDAPDENDEEDKSGDVMKVIETPQEKPAGNDDAAETEGKEDEEKPEETNDDSSEDETEDSSDGRELCVAKVEDMMNVRAEASEEAKVVGYMYKDCVGEIVERGDGWTKIRSGKLDGWAKNDYLYFGDEAKERTEKTVREIAVINTGGLRVRAEASEEAEVKAMLAEGDEVDVIDAENEEWTKISFEDGTSGEDTGYVSNEYISIKVSYKTGETIEEVKDREEKSKAAREASEKSKKEEKKSGSKSDNGGSTSAPATTNSGSVSASVDDETLLAALIQCECNGPYDAQLAVGAVVVNRAKAGYGSISNAIYAPYQFGPASSGKLAATISSGAISASARQAAKDAISGVSNVGGARYFRNVKSGHAGVVIGNHVYW